MRTGDRVVRDRRAIARRSLFLPGIVVLYALLGFVWHPLLLGPHLDVGCGLEPWFVVFVTSLVLGGLFFVVGATLTVALQPRAAGLWVLASGLLLACSAVLVLAVVGASDYLVCST